MTSAPVDIVDRDKWREILPIGLQADGTLTRKAMPFAFVLGTLSVFVALPLGVLGVILNSMGMERVQSDPAKARKLVAWSWGIFIVTDTLAVLGIVVALLLG